MKNFRILKRNKIQLILILIIFCLISYIIYNAERTGLKDSINNFGKEVGIDFPKMFYGFESIINIFRDTSDLQDGKLPQFNLKLSNQDIKHFNLLTENSLKKGYLNKKNNTWRNAKLSINGKKYDIKIKLHGDLPNHWANKLKSFKVKLTKNSLNGLTKFNLIIFEDDFFYPRIIRILFNEFGLFDIRDDFVALFGNGNLLGFYYLQESLGKDFLEHNQCSNCEIIKLNDNMLRDHTHFGQTEDGILMVKNPYSIGYLGAHITPFDFEVANVDLEKSELNIRSVLFAVNLLFEDIKEKNLKIEKYFDLDQLSSFEAVRMLFGGGISVDGDNLILIYRGTNSKFYPIAKEGKLKYLKTEKGGFEHQLSKRGDLNLKLFELINRNDKLRQMKYQKAYNYITNNQQKLLNEIDKELKYYLPYINSYRANKIGTRPLEKLVLSSTEILKSNFDTIKEALEYSRVYVNVINSENKILLDIIPDSISQLEISQLKIDLNKPYSGKVTLNYIDDSGKNITRNIMLNSSSKSLDISTISKDLRFSTGLDENMYPQKRTYKISIKFEDVIQLKNVNLKFINDITKKPLQEEDIHIQIAKGNKNYEVLRKMNSKEFIRNYPEFEWEEKENKVILKKGEYVLKRDLIIPEHLEVYFEPGVKIHIALNKSIISYSPVNIVGSEESPVIITSLKPQEPFATFGMVGSGKENVKISWLEISGGNEKWANGIYFSGALSIHHMNVYMDNTKVFNNHADDGMNIKYSKVVINESTFFNNFADQLDLDFVKGIIKNTEFKEEISRDSNGDGLDLSGSKVIIKNNKFKGFKDKGISIGENTKAIVLNNKIAKNNLGVAVKDSSKVYFLNNFFSNNKIAVSAYQKKLIFDGGISFFYNNLYESNNKKYQSDKKSQKYEIKSFSEEELKEYISTENLIKSFEVLEGENLIKSETQRHE